MSWSKINSRGNNLRIENYWVFENVNSRTKIISLATLKSKISYLHRQGKTVVFTNGCFDILHFGHVHYLEKAKRNNRILIVGLNSDASVRKIKGEKRPILPQGERARILAALSCVDFVVIFNEATPYRLIETVKPDVLIKGADWKKKTVVGEDVVLRLGGRVEFAKYLKGFSTTSTIQKILKTCRK